MINTRADRDTDKEQPTMKRKLSALILAGLTVSTVWAGDRYPVEVSRQPDQKWHFQRLTAFTSDGETHISGRLTANLPYGLPRGHVDVAAYSPSGELLAETTTDYVPAILTHTMKKKGGVRFSTTLDKAIPDDAIIKVAFHREPPIAKTKPTHSGNIAR
jgi:hypothetical protein